MGAMKNQAIEEAEKQSQNGEFDSMYEHEARQQEAAETKNLHFAMINVMNEVKNIDKGLTVGFGSNSYKGVADKDVKLVIGQSMARNGLTCITIDIKPTMNIHRWEESFNGNVKQKQTVFTEVLVKYLITHAETGECTVIMGYGHGADTQDKSAGKATTYALKNALLYTFLVPTGAIEDTETDHSSAIPVPVTNLKPVAKEPTKPMITEESFQKAKTAVEFNGVTLDAIKNRYKLTPIQENEIISIINEKKQPK